MANFVYADEPEFDLSNKPLNQPTLDYLKENNILIPQKGAWNADDETWTDADSISSPGSAYTLTKVDAEGENTITKYTLDGEAHELVPQYFRVGLKKTTYGEGTNVKYYEWSTDENGNRTFSEVTTPTAGKTTVEFRYNPDSYSNIYDNKANVEFFRANGNEQYYAGGALKVTEKETTSLIDTLFINNSSTGVYRAHVLGGALFNDGIIEKLVADFIGNSASSFEALGGAIDNEGTIGDITGDFIGNRTSNLGGGIFNYGTIGNISGNFIGNTAITTDSLTYVAGGGIYNKGKIENITGNFIGNSIYSSIETFSSFVGGGIYNNRTIGTITGDFIGNSVSASGGSYAFGGGIYNSGTIGSITGDFVGNSVSASDKTSGGGIYNTGTIRNITGDFIGNSVTSSSSGAYGGAIYTKGTIGAEDAEGNIIGGITNSSFINNYAKSLGGAIYTENRLNIIADNGISVFKGNYVQSGKDYQAIFVYPLVQTGTFEYMPYINSCDRNTLTLKSLNNGSIYMYDNINGTKGEVSAYWNSATIDGYNVVITGDNTGTLYLFNDMYNAHVSLENTNLNTINNDIHTYNFDSFTLTNNANMLVDVDLENNQMDRITAYNSEDGTHNYGAHNGVLTVSGMNLISDAPAGQDVTEILFADPGLKDNVSNGVTTETPTGYQTTAYTPIYKYAVSYNNKDDGGYFEFTRGGKYVPPVKPDPSDPTEPVNPSNPGGVVVPPTNPSDNFNPAVLDSPVASRAGAQSAISETVRFAFQHMDTFSQLPFAERMAIINANKYAINDTEATPHYNTDLHQGATKGYWIRPYTSFEKINLHNGPDVDAITYGTLVGLDSNFKPLRNGWYNVQSVYAGYNGSSLSYSGVDTTLNGGVLGLTETFYKDNFFTALTATAGASMATGSTMYGNEDYAMLVGGIGAKGGYNFEFKQGKYILQPIMFANYSFVNTFDYTNAAGVKMTSTPLHTLQLNPQLKFVSNLKNGWQPYASVGVVWNVLNTSKVKANDVILPRMTVDPYVEYGLGLQRNWKDKYTGFAQAMVRNGGRNGVALTFGFRWALGKEAL